MITHLSRWLAQQPGLDLKMGANLFVGPVSESELAKMPDRIVVLIERPGPPETFGLVGQGRLQVLVRDATLFRARDLAWRVHRTLHETFNRRFDRRDAKDQVTGADDVWAILGDAEPVATGHDARGRPTFLTTYTIARSEA